MTQARAKADFTVAIVGRPNVGKSTLFNRLTKRRLALVDDLPGLTRDRREGRARFGALRFRVFDTPGFEDAEGKSIEARMRRQTEIAAASADLVLLVIDAREGVTSLDREFARVLRRLESKVLLVANKCEGKAGIPGLAEGHGLGFGDPVPVSAEHAEGFAELQDAIRARMPPEPVADGDGERVADDDEEDITKLPPEQRPIRLAIIGRPNVGKSTLVNRLLGEERMLTGPEPGITRDAVMTLARDSGLEVQEHSLPRGMLHTCDELFFTGTAVEIAPIRSVDRIPVGDGRPGPITRRLMAEFQSIVTGRIPDRHGWLTPLQALLAGPVLAEETVS